MRKIALLLAALVAVVAVVALAVTSGPTGTPTPVGTSVPSSPPTTAQQFAPDGHALPPDDPTTREPRVSDPQGTPDPVPLEGRSNKSAVIDTVAPSPLAAARAKGIYLSVRRDPVTHNLFGSYAQTIGGGATLFYCLLYFDPQESINDNNGNHYGGGVRLVATGYGPGIQFQVHVDCSNTSSDPVILRVDQTVMTWKSSLNGFFTALGITPNYKSQYGGAGYGFSTWHPVNFIVPCKIVSGINEFKGWTFLAGNNQAGSDTDSGFTNIAFLHCATKAP